MADQTGSAAQRRKDRDNLCVDKNRVEIERPKARPPRYGDAPEKLKEDLDSEYREIVG